MNLPGMPIRTLTLNPNFSCCYSLLHPQSAGRLDLRRREKRTLWVRVFPLFK